MFSKKSADAGVRELQRFEKRSGGSFHWRVFDRSCASMRATRRPDVTGFAPVVTEISKMWVRAYRAVSSLTQGSEQTQACRAASHTYDIIDVWLPSSAGVGASE